MTSASCPPNPRAGAFTSVDVEKAAELPPDAKGCSAHILIAITNFTTLRRRLGCKGWNAHMAALIDQIALLHPDALAMQAAADVIAIALQPATRQVLQRNVDTLIDSCCAPSGRPGIQDTLDCVAGAAFASGMHDEVALIEQAEGALADARRLGRSVIAAAIDGDHGMSERMLARDLGKAVGRGEFFVVYQPKVHVRRRSVSSAEALIRWQHPEHGLIMPDAFIPMADETGDIREIALWTLDRVIADQRELASKGHPLRIFVNISGRLLTDRWFIEAACALVAPNPEAIGFEITETSVIRDPDLAIANLERCTAAGIMLAIDDYGSGLSSLSYLKRLPASELKIDKMFVTQLTNSHRDPLIVRSTIDLAHALDMEVTAEGVETPAALALLSVMGCEMVQGYLISQPLPLAEFATYLADYSFEALGLDVAPTVLRPASFWKRA